MNKNDMEVVTVAKVYMMCGKICSGKSTHATELRALYHAVVLSVDEITLALFGQDAGDKHDDYVERAERYLYKIISRDHSAWNQCGSGLVILDKRRTCLCETILQRKKHRMGIALYRYFPSGMAETD